MTPDEARKSVSCLWCGEFFRHRDTYENHSCYRAFLAGQLQGRRAEQMGAFAARYAASLCQRDTAREAGVMSNTGTNYSNLRGYRWPMCRCGHSRRWHGSVRLPRRCFHCECRFFVEQEAAP